MNEFYEFESPSLVTVGTIGPPGQRVFYLQAQQAGELVTVKVEKQQVSALAIHLGELLQDLSRPGHIPEGDELELVEFADTTFIVGAIGVAYDAVADRVILVVEERVEEDVDPSEARLALSREQAAALAIRGTQLVEAGRPPCPLCGFPLDPSGHACPRTNGNRAPNS
jgi:uncharacterized repeat protein (TIGR03847 family)